MSTAPTKPKSSWINLLVDYGPLLVCFLAYRHFKPEGTDAGLAEVVAVTKGTATFMVATVVALIISKWRLGKVSPMLWLSTALILGFGTLTLLLGDPFWIQVKPTAIYLLFAGVLFAGLARGKPMLRILLEAAFEGLSDEGWLKLSRNWGVFFLGLALLNETLRAQMDFEGWLWAKIWVFLPLTFLFTFSQLPMLLKHGLSFEEKDEVLKDEPPTG